MFELQKPQLGEILIQNPTPLRTDASSIGLGAFLEQNYETVDNEK